MRPIMVVMAAAALLAGSHAALAAVDIEVNKDIQQMTVSVDGVVKYRWPVSSGNPSHETPNGSYQTFRMEEDHYSKEFDDAPMPHSIFFTKMGHAIHGTDSVKNLGNPVSHGCVRLSRANASTLWDLVKREGLFKTHVTLTGSSRVALARARTNVATTTTDAPDGDVAIASGQAMPRNIAPRTVYGSPTADHSDDSSVPSYGGYQNRGYQNRTVQAPQDGISAPDPRNPNRRIYVDPRYGRGYSDNDYAQSDDPYQQRPAYQTRPGTFFYNQ